jgi:hypothetical protein
MRQAGPGSLLDQLLGLCFGLLLAAIAVHVAVRLIESVWPVLLLILAVIGLLGLGVWLIRSRGPGW